MIKVIMESTITLKATDLIPWC